MHREILRMYLGNKADQVQQFQKNPHLRLKIDGNGFIDFQFFDKLTNIWKILEDN